MASPIRSVILLVLSLVGCKPAPAPPPPGTPPPAIASAAARPERPADQPESVALPESAPGSASDEQDLLREHAARLLRPDGAGGWLSPDEAAATELEKLGPAAFDLLAPLLADPSADVRRGAAYHLLSQFDPAQPAQVEAFAKLLDDDDRTVRGFGLAAAGQMNRGDQVAAVQRLTNMLAAGREPQPDNRAKVVRLIGSLKRDADSAYEQVAKSAKEDPDARVRSAALAALAQIAEPERSLEIFVRALGDADPAVCIVAAARLRQMGPQAAQAAPNLAAHLSSADEGVRERAAEALVAIGPPAVDSLAATLGGNSVEARRQALAALAKLGPEAAAARSAIEKCLGDEDELARKLAEAALRRIGPAQRD